MIINSDSWHYKFLFGDSWYGWDLDPRRYHTICQYVRQILFRMLCSAALAVFFALLATAAGSFVLSPLVVLGVWVYSGVFVGGALPAIGAVVDVGLLCWLVAHVFRERLVDVRYAMTSKWQGLAQPVKTSVFAQYIKDWKAKHCTLITYDYEQ